jgi:hypothetical protein
LFVAAADSFRADTAASALSIATPDGFGELVHPSVWDSGSTWNGKRYWMAATPYHASDATLENPCIYCSDSLDGPWAAPGGLTNPIEATPGGSDYNSDPHLVWPGDGYLYCVWRVVTGGTSETLYYRRSSDGVVWGSKTMMYTALQSVRRLVSPAIEWDGTQWVMYAVDILPSPNTVVRLTAPALTGTWSAPTICTLTVPAGRDPWHLDAKYRAGAWFLLLQEAALDATAGGNLSLCKSSDGLTFTRPTNYVMPRLGNWHDICYRSCLVPKIANGKLAFDLIYSGITAAAQYYLGRSVITAFDKATFDAEPATAIAGAVSNTAPYLIGDNFNRADGAVGTSSGGEAWTASAGTVNVSSNQAVASAAANTRAYLEAGQADGYVEATISGVNGTNQTWLVARFSDANNFWRIGFIANVMYIQKIVAASATTLRTVTNFYPGNLGMPSTARIGLRMSGNNFALIYEGNVAITWTDAFNATATKHGVQMDNTTTRFDNFFARALVNGA